MKSQTQIKRVCNTVFLTFGLFIWTEVAFAQLPYFESFTGSTATGVTVAGSATLTDTNSNPLGVLRLTDNAINQTGYVFSDATFLPAGGLELEFEFFVYGTQASLADGFSFFLYDGSVDAANFQIGSAGGALGYSQRSLQLPTAQFPGVSRAYLGIGFDVFGGFTRNNEGKQGGFSATTPRSITLRGAGDGNALIPNNYPFLTTYQFPNIDPYHFPQQGTRISDSTDSRYRKALIRLKPRTGIGFNVDVFIIKGGATFDTVKAIENYSYDTPVPPTLKYGIAGTTGGTRSIQEIRNLSVKAYNPMIIPPTAEDIILTSCENTSITIDFAYYARIFGCPANCINPNSIDLDPINNPGTDDHTFTVAGKGTFTYNQNTQLIEFVPVTDFDGDVEVDYTFADVSGTRSGPAKIIIDVVPGGTCSDIKLSVSRSSSSPSVGSQVTYTFTAENLGPANATGVNVNLPASIPSGFTFVSAIPSGSSTYNSSTGVWNIGGINSSSSETLEVVFTVNKNDNHHFKVTVESSSIDFNPTNDTAFAIVTAYPLLRHDASVGIVGITVNGDLSTNDKFNTKPSYTFVSSQSSNPTSTLPTVNSNGTFSFTETTLGAYHFLVRASYAGEQWDDTLSIFMVDPNNPTGNPVAAYPDYIVTRSLVNQPANRTVDVISNDKSGNWGGSIDPSSLSIIEMPTHGTATIPTGDNRIRYVPNAGFSGQDKIVYEICDNSSNCARSTVYVTVLGPGEIALTLAGDNSFQTEQATQRNVILSEGLHNHSMTFPFASLTSTLVSTTPNGQLSLSSNGAFTYTPNIGFSGVDRFVADVCASSNCSRITVQIIVSRGNVWTGSIDSDWENAGNWLINAVPPSNTSVVVSIPQVTAPNVYPSISNQANEVRVGILKLAENTRLTVEAGSAIFAQNSIENAAGAKITLDANATGYAQLRYQTNSYIGTGTVIQRMYIEGEGWHQVSIQMQGQTASVFGQVGTDRHINAQNLFRWDVEDYDYVNIPNGSQNLERGVGYLAYFGTNGVQEDTGPWTIEVEGIPAYNVSRANTILYTPSGNWTDFVPGRGDGGWILLGNPFTTSFNFGGMNAVSSGSLINNAFYIWNPSKTDPGNGDRYEFYSGGGISAEFIAPMQSFWVQAKSSSTNLAIFTVNMSTHASNRMGANRPVFFRTSSNSVDFDRLVLRTVESADTNAHDYTVVSFIEGTTDGYDGDWDAHKMYNGSTHPNIYSRDTTGYFLAVNAIDYGPGRQEKRSLPISFKASKHGVSYDISYDQSYMQNSYSVFLEDKKTGGFHDLRNGAYAFVNDTAFVDRFVLHFQSGILSINLADLSAEKSLRSWTYASTLYLESKEHTPANIEIYDMNAKRIWSTRADLYGGSISEIPLPESAAGMYLIRINTPQHSRVLKYMR
ncbi:MAG: DUF11 domain-containing protein [Flavobacteriales bacterium]|nr:MAG: DUF11 domain-containing protein [Flavobacteriales bacterium]